MKQPPINVWRMTLNARSLRSLNPIHSAEDSPIPTCLNAGFPSTQKSLTLDPHSDPPPPSPLQKIPAVYVLDMRLLPGMEGAPLVDSSGVMLGALCLPMYSTYAATEVPLGIPAAVLASTVRAFLQRSRSSTQEGDGQGSLKPSAASGGREAAKMVGIRAKKHPVVSTQYMGHGSTQAHLPPPAPQYAVRQYETPGDKWERDKTYAKPLGRQEGVDLVVRPGGVASESCVVHAGAINGPQHTQHAQHTQSAVQRRLGVLQGGIQSAVEKGGLSPAVAIARRGVVGISAAGGKWASGVIVNTCVNQGTVWVLVGEYWSRWITGMVNFMRDGLLGSSQRICVECDL